MRIAFPRGGGVQPPDTQFRGARPERGIHVAEALRQFRGPGQHQQEGMLPGGELARGEQRLADLRVQRVRLVNHQDQGSAPGAGLQQVLRRRQRAALDAPLEGRGKHRKGDFAGVGTARATTGGAMRCASSAALAMPDGVRWSTSSPGSDRTALFFQPAEEHGLPVAPRAIQDDGGAGRGPVRHRACVPAERLLLALAPGEIRRRPSESRAERPQRIRCGHSAPILGGGSGVTGSGWPSRARGADIRAATSCRECAAQPRTGTARSAGQLLCKCGPAATTGTAWSAGL